MALFSLSYDGEESVATARTLFGWAQIHKNHHTSEHFLWHGGVSYGRCALYKSGDASAGKQPIGVRASSSSLLYAAADRCRRSKKKALSLAALATARLLDSGGGGNTGTETMRSENIRVCCRWPQRRLRRERRIRVCVYRVRKFSR